MNNNNIEIIPYAFQLMTSYLRAGQFLPVSLPCASL